MEKMNSVIIDRAERGKSGEGSWGKWQAWSVWFVGMEPKFDYFERDNVVPFPGMRVEVAEYTVEQNGQYTNYKLKKMVPAKLAGVSVGVSGPPVQAHKLSPVAPAVVDYEKEKRLTMCTSYAKDLMVQMLSDSYKEKSFKAIIELVAKGGKLLAERLGEKLDVVPKPEVTVQLPEFVEPTLTVPEPPVLMPEMVVTPGMAKAANEVLVTPVVLPTPEVDIPDNDIPF